MQLLLGTNTREETLQVYVFSNMSLKKPNPTQQLECIQGNTEYQTTGRTLDIISLVLDKVLHESFCLFPMIKKKDVKRL